MMRRYVFIYIVCAVVSSTVSAATSDLRIQADSAYQAGDYRQAITLYDSIMATEGQSTEICYNIGGAHFKDGDIAHAILYYERALLLSPGDEDVRFNLEFARSQTIDRIVPHHEIFLLTWWRSMVSMANADTWAITAVTAFCCMLICILLFLFIPRMWVQRTGFYLSLLLLAGCIISNICAWQQANRETNCRGAIVMTSSAVVRSTPSESGTELFVLHEGTRVDITDDTMQGWKEIVLADGKRGWVEMSRIEKI